MTGTRGPGEDFLRWETTMHSEEKRVSRSDRRRFLKAALLQATAVGTAGLASAEPQTAVDAPLAQRPFSSDPFEIRKLTDRVSCTRLGFGTGMASGTELRGLGEEQAIDLLRYSYERGVRLFDAADSYRTHQIVREALRGQERGSYTLVSKMWLHRETEKPLDEQLPARDILARFLRELGTDYIDILQIHCMMKPGWETVFARYMDELDVLKDEGLILSHGVSCHSIEAAKEAAVHPWVDVIHLRFNPFGARMDGSVEENLQVLKTAREHGKGTIIMKVAGEGSFADSEMVGQSIRYIAKLETADTMVVGMKNREQIDFLIECMSEALKEEELVRAVA